MGGNRAPRTPRNRALLSVLILVASLFGVAAPVVAPAVAPAAQALSGTDFNPAYIVSDANFYDSTVMSASDIQAFLAAREPGTCGGTCLKNYSQATPSIPADPMCQAYAGSPNESAATIIAKVAVSCGISPRTILVTLQKEQSLVTSTQASASAMSHAMGANCPDTSACDPNYAGFFNQVHRGAYLMKRYTDPPGTGPGTPYYSVYSTAYPVGQSKPIAYSPNATCGSSPVTVQNRATHVLYVYTPYQPNAAALEDQYLYGAVPSKVSTCSSYGNRNFWVYWNTWFGSPTKPNDSPYGAITSVTTSQGSITLHGWALDDGAAPNAAVEVHAFAEDTYEGAASANQTDSSLSSFWPSSAGTAHVFTITINNAPTGTHNWCVNGYNVAGTAGSNTQIACTVATVPFCGSGYACPSPLPSAASARIAGTDRFATAVQIAQKTYPTTASTVYVTTGANFADALSAAPAAAAAHAPLLLTDTTTLPSNVASEITSLHPAKVVVVGGPAAVSNSVVSALQSAVPSATVSRISGADRFETSANVAATMSATQAYVVTGVNFPDALSADSVGAAQGRPVLLVPGTASTLPASTLSYLASSGLTDLTIVGGTAAVTPAIQTQLAGLSTVHSVTRISGADRFAVSAAVNQAVYPSPASVYFASGVNYPDALSGAVLAAAKSAPLYLSDTTCVRSVVLDEVFDAESSSISLIGGTAALQSTVGLMTECVN